MNLDKHDAVFVDVDGTLLLWPGRKPGRIPRKGEPHYGEPPAINTALVGALQRWHHAGRLLVIWSRGGKQHSEYAARLCGLRPDACLPKPELAIDDHAENPKRFDVIGPHAR